MRLTISLFYILFVNFVNMTELEVFIFNVGIEQF